MIMEQLQYQQTPYAVQATVVSAPSTHFQSAAPYSGQQQGWTQSAQLQQQPVPEYSEQPLYPSLPRAPASVNYSWNQQPMVAPTPQYAHPQYSGYSAPMAAQPAAYPAAAYPMPNQIALPSSQVHVIGSSVHVVTSQCVIFIALAAAVISDFLCCRGSTVVTHHPTNCYNPLAPVCVPLSYITVTQPAVSVPAPRPYGPATNFLPEYSGRHRA